MGRRAEAGFSLVESVTALFVFAIAAASVLELNIGGVRAIGSLETSVYARIVADNQMALALGQAADLPRDDASGADELAGRTWSWRRIVSPTTDIDIDRVDVIVRLDGEDRVAAQLTGFRGRR